MRSERLPVMVAFFVSFLSWAPIVPAAEKGVGLYRVTCPPYYPGPEKRGAKLTYQAGWYSVHSPFGPPESVALSGDETILIDCGYDYPAGQPSREDLTPYRVIVAVPGHVERCGGATDKQHPYWCDTAPEEDGTIGPVKLYISERISLSTTLKGFGLGRNREEMSAHAAVEGLVCTEQGEIGGEAVSVCSRQEEESVTIRFTNGRSRVVEWLRQGDVARRRELYAETIFRFGTELWKSRGPAQVSTWMEKGGKAKLELAAPWDRFNMVLTDLTVPAPR